MIIPVLIYLTGFAIAMKLMFQVMPKRYRSSEMWENSLIAAIMAGFLSWVACVGIGVYILLNNMMQD